MSTMTKITWIIALLVWIFGLIILIIALTNLIPNNPFKEYRLIIGLGFLVISGFIGNLYKKQKKQHQPLG